MSKLTQFEKETLEQKLPGFAALLEAAKTEDADCVTAIDAFTKNPVLFYLAMEYASDKGVSVTLLPKLIYERQKAYEESKPTNT